MTTNFKFCVLPFFIFLCFFMFLSVETKGQSVDCTIDQPEEPESVSNADFWCHGYLVRIVFHVVRRSDGTGGATAAQITAAQKILVKDFAPNIQFKFLETDFVDDDAFYTGNAYKIINGGVPPLFEDLVLKNKNPKAVNVYLGPSDNPFDNGTASQSRIACVMAGSRADDTPANPTYLVTSRAISHEVGHVLGLLHTFQNNDEFVDGSNCGTKGDKVCDTPADPTSVSFDYRPFLSSCNWNNTTQRDSHNDLYMPNTHNIMAYTYLNCMTAFTQGQLERMVGTCASVAVIKPLIADKLPRCLLPVSLMGIVKKEPLNTLVSPNPTSDYIFVQFLSDSEEIELNLSDITGRKIYTKNIGKIAKGDYQEIDVTTFPKGMYILTINNEAEKKTSKIVIQ